MQKLEEPNQPETGEKIRVLIVDDHVIFCESLASLLTMGGKVEVVGIAHDGEKALKITRELRPDIILMDIEMKGIDGLQATSDIKKEYPDTRVVVLTMHSDEEYLFEAVKAGANGYMLKESSSAHLLETINAVARGESLLDTASTSKILKKLRNFMSSGITDGRKSVLSAREKEILHLIMDGYNNRAIANKLTISENTVRNHLANIFFKLNCNCRTKAIAEASRRGLI